MVGNDNASKIAVSRGKEEEVVRCWSIEKLDWVIPERLVMSNGRPPIWSSVSTSSSSHAVEPYHFQHFIIDSRDKGCARVYHILTAIKGVITSKPEELLAIF